MQGNSTLRPERVIQMDRVSQARRRRWLRSTLTEVHTVIRDGLDGDDPEMLDRAVWCAHRLLSQAVVELCRRGPA